MGNEQNTLNRQTAKFVAACIENLPNISGEIMQGFIGKPQKLKTRLLILKAKRIAVIGNSLDFLAAFYDSAKIFLGERNLGEEGSDYSVLRAEYEDTDRIVFVDFSCCMLAGSSEACEVYGGNTLFYKETRKFEMIISDLRADKFDLFIFDPEFLKKLESKDKQRFIWFMSLFEPKKTQRGDIIPNQFLFKI
ncbi:MAG: hypothetical protein LiPW41_656 [Parcubacteria group bacterium LiPW_41]|nr:MAG: hypothetical protein LiPW41_656 [Parcubacteria group bacterium LiPW_41]